MKNMKDVGAKTAKQTNTPTPALGKEVQARIGEQLRSMYDDLIRQPVPDRLTELLQKLDKTDRKEP